MEIKINGIQEESVVDGPGLRYVIFTQGCPHHCKGCQNPQTHPLEGGEKKSSGDIVRAIGQNPLLRGVTFSGGEPFLQPEPLISIGKEVKARGKNIWCYTGYTWEELWAKGEKERELLTWIDVLVDGPFILERKSLDIGFRGSDNQRILRLKEGKIQEIIE